MFDNDPEFQKLREIRESGYDGPIIPRGGKDGPIIPRGKDEPRRRPAEPPRKPGKES